MTRTARAVSPRAMIKDRHENKSGKDTSVRKGGSGPHNWGSLDDEGKLEDEAMDDVDEDRDGTQVEPEPKGTERRTSSATEEDRESARNFRKGALKGEGIDLSAIARTSSAVSSSPPNKAELDSDEIVLSIEEHRGGKGR